LLHLSTVVASKNNSRAWVKIQSARWVNIQSADTSSFYIAFWQGMFYPQENYQLNLVLGGDAWHILQAVVLSFFVPLALIGMWINILCSRFRK
jgi:hypothetical protein